MPCRMAALSAIAELPTIAQRSDATQKNGKGVVAWGSRSRADTRGGMCGKPYCR